MDRDRVSAITHGDLPFHNPLDPARIDEAIARLALGPGDRVLDVGCGPGELLVRIAERTGAGGVGIDRSPIVVEAARARAAARVPDAELEFRAEDADTPEGTFAAACCLGSSHALGGLEPALARRARDDRVRVDRAPATRTNVNGGWVGGRVSGHGPSSGICVPLCGV